MVLMVMANPQATGLTRYVYVYSIAGPEIMDIVCNLTYPGKQNKKCTILTCKRMSCGCCVEGLTYKSLVCSYRFWS